MPEGDHECDWPQSREGNWTSIGRCRICNTVPSFEQLIKLRPELAVSRKKAN